jgi:hypothetical protein
VLREDTTHKLDIAQAKARIFTFENKGVLVAPIGGDLALQIVPAGARSWIFRHSAERPGPNGKLVTRRREMSAIELDVEAKSLLRRWFGLVIWPSETNGQTVRPVNRYPSLSAICLAY